MSDVHPSPAHPSPAQASRGPTASLQKVHSGKVRDLFRTDDGLLIMVASDRISAFDHVLDSPIPDKGRILTALSVWWFERCADLVPNHLVRVDDPRIPSDWLGRALVCEPLEMLQVECIARGYLTGSGLVDYQAGGAVCGVELPAGLQDGSRLPEPIFTPTTKAELGEHDTAITFDQVVAAVGADTAARLREITLAVYRRGAELAARAGVLLADTKVEIGRRGDGTLVLADELLTPDSSRFWPAEQWAVGASPPSYDKQFVRNWLLSAESGWDRSGGEPPPPLPAQIVTATRRRYLQAYEQITGLRLADWPGA